MTETSWDGAFNLWDLGGLPTDRGPTPSGVVFRSGSRETLTNQGWRDAKRAGLETIVDLRNESERLRLDHHPIIDADALEGIGVVFAPTEDPDDPEFMRVCGPWLDHPRSYADNLRFYPAKFRTVFKAIARSRGPVLIHCSGGRDRTGMVVAMLLALAGVSADLIADDYERAFREAHAHQTRHPEQAREQLYSEEELGSRVAERRAAMVEWIGHFDVAGYLREIGLDEADRTRLRNLLRDAG
ncbi:MAG TPA: tyrosine-protein phosphatase [Lacisediminihabitans sp.]|uniref:tyrosine-protein phosphatase n=1 Tax=Lacisediminihabitans sp. TaxID=2787631 RepID=UPI002ED9AD0B